MIDKVAAAYEKAECLAAYGRHLANAFDGPVDEWNGIVFCDPKLAWKARNMVVPVRPIDEAARVQLRERVNDFYDSDQWVLWNVFGDELSESGFRLGEAHPVMARFVAPEVRPVPEGLIITEVKDDAGVRTFEEVRQVADVYPPLYDPTPGRFFDARVLSPNHRLWLGYVDDVPVATAASFVNGDLNIVKNVSTAASHRGLGIGLAMSEHAAAANDKRPILDGAENAVPMYAKLGFEVVGQNAFWVSG